jgi:hypothetical protein
MVDSQIPIAHSEAISLSFFPLLDDNFDFSIYRLEARGERKDELPDTAIRHSLPISTTDGEERKDYWVTLYPCAGFEEFRCKSDYNQYVSRQFLHAKLIQSCRATDPRIDAEEDAKLVKKRVLFKIQAHYEGDEIVWLQAHFLKSAKKFGFLADFWFRKKPNTPFTRRVQQLSLSLDKGNRENKNFYSDRYDKLQQFITANFDKVFPLSNEHQKIEVVRKLVQLQAGSLDKKTYVFRNGIHDSQFIGIRRHLPLTTLSGEPTIFFVYRPPDRPLSVDLYKALRGEKFPNVFPGTEKMFGFAIGPGNIKGIAVSDFKEEEMARVADIILKNELGPVLALIIAPWKNEEEEDSEEYFRAKHIFVGRGIPSQVVRVDTLGKDYRLQWSTSNIALQCFAKLGGKPWKVRPRNERCLIIGVGQSHREDDVGGTRIIRRYYAYSVLTESSGLFKELRVLGRAEDSTSYLAQLKNSVSNIVRDNEDLFDRFVIHATYKIRIDELKSIQEVFENIHNKDNKQFVVLRINENNDYFGYSVANNSLVPFESTYAPLAWDEFLVWFDGLQYHNPKVARRYARPLDISFYYSSTDLTQADRLNYLQDALNLSGANWRGFNAKSMPVSIYYAQLIARFINKFDQLGLPEIEIENLTPWFL